MRQSLAVAALLLAAAACRGEDYPWSFPDCKVQPEGYGGSIAGDRDDAITELTDCAGRDGFPPDQIHVSEAHTIFKRAYYTGAGRSGASEVPVVGALCALGTWGFRAVDSAVFGDMADHNKREAVMHAVIKRDREWYMDVYNVDALKKKTIAWTASFGLDWEEKDTHGHTVVTHEDMCEKFAETVVSVPGQMLTADTLAAMLGMWKAHVFPGSGCLIASVQSYFGRKHSLRADETFCDQSADLDRAHYVRDLCAPDLEEKRAHALIPTMDLAELAAELEALNADV